MAVFPRTAIVSFTAKSPWTIARVTGLLIVPVLGCGVRTDGLHVRLLFTGLIWRPFWFPVFNRCLLQSEVGELGIRVFES